MGSPLLVLGLMVLGTARLLHRSFAVGWTRLSGRDRFLLLLAAAAFALIAISVKVWDYSAWYWVYQWVPGASAMRVPGRILIVVDMMAIVIAVCTLDQFAGGLTGRSNIRKRLIGASVVAAATILVAEQLNSAPFLLNKNQQLAKIGQYQAPDSHCEAFYVVNAEPANLPIGYYQNDAMMVTMKLGIPTANGYSGFQPHGAFALRPAGHEYQYRILQWLLENGATEQICELDLQTTAWRPINVPGEYQVAQKLYVADFLETFSALYDAARAFLSDGNNVSDIYPQYLEEHGYLDPTLGYETGRRYRWLNDRYWIGSRACGQAACFGIGVLGSYLEVQGILETYGRRARKAIFPAPDVWRPDQPPSHNATGELVLLFPVAETVP